MSSLEELWKALRSSGLESLAPTLVQKGVLSVNQLAQRAAELVDAGLKQWQLEAVLASASQREGASEAPTERRRDLPVHAHGRRASFLQAMQAAEPNSRQQSLQLLDNDMLARSTNPANDARVKTYLALCRAWEVPAFPLDNMNVRCFAASLK